MNNISSDIFALINPAYMSLIIRKFLEGYTTEKEDGCFIYIPYIIIPLLLSEKTRRTIQNSQNRKGLLNWITEYPENKVPLNKQIRGLKKYIKDALLFGIQLNLFLITEEGNLKLGNNKPIKNKLIATNEIKEVMINAEKIGKWCGKMRNETDIFYNLGVEI